MPYARTRTQDALNKAYAHIVAENFAEAAANLADRMVQNMGFERFEAAGALIPQQGTFAGVDDFFAVPKTPAIPDCHVQLESAPDTRNWPDDVKRAVEIHPTSQGATVLIPGNIDRHTREQVESFIEQSVPAKARENVRAQFDAHRALRQALTAPSQRGEQFAPVPQLCLDLDGHLELVERETLSELGDWDLLDGKVQLAGFAIHELIHSFEIDVSGERVKYRHIDERQLQLDAVPGAASEQDLVRWLDAETRQPWIPQRQLQAYLVKMVTHLIHERVYRGRYEFRKHFYPAIHDLRETTAGGKQSEEFLCAQALDAHPKVKHWVRNIERQEKFSFWLPTATDYFYPDFIAELTDGRVLAVEYKGEIYATNDDSREKNQVGDQWEKSSGGRCLFLFAVAEDEDGRSVARQIADKIG